MKKFSKTYTSNTKGIYNDPEFWKGVDFTAKILKGLLKKSLIAVAVIFDKPSTTRQHNPDTSLKGCLGDSQTHSYIVHSALPCHGLLKINNMDKAVCVITRLNYANIGKADLSTESKEAFLNYLFNYSPYHRAFLSKNATKVIKQGYVVCRTDVPGPLLLGACIASRRVWQYDPELIRLWRGALRESYSPFTFLKPKRGNKEITNTMFFITLLMGRNSGRPAVALKFEVDPSDSQLIDIDDGVDKDGFIKFRSGTAPMAKVNNWMCWYYTAHDCYPVINMWKKNDNAAQRFSVDVKRWIHSCFTEAVVTTRNLGGNPYVETSYNITPSGVEKLCKILLQLT